MTTKGSKKKCAMCIDDTTDQSPNQREASSRVSQQRDIVELGLPQNPKMRVVHPPRGAHYMYGTAGKSLISPSSDSTRDSTRSSVRKRNYIIFDENDEDTLI